ncbi:MAG: BcpO-related WXXGXW repeat protein [Gammaproteobacteria bacterium]|nr:BcpO-related WXXGXW repeat protein [Gammaproteobacteria bacterium]
MSTNRSPFGRRCAIIFSDQPDRCCQDRCYATRAGRNFASRFADAYRLADPPSAGHPGSHVLQNGHWASRHHARPGHWARHVRCRSGTW